MLTTSLEEGRHPKDPEIHYIKLIFFNIQQLFYVLQGVCNYRGFVIIISHFDSM